MFSFTTIVENLVRAFPDYKHDFSYVYNKKTYPDCPDIEIKRDIACMRDFPYKNTINYDFYLLVETINLGIGIDKDRVFIGDILRSWNNFDFLQGLCIEHPMTPGIYKMLSCIYNQEWIDNMTISIKFEHIPMPKMQKL